MLNKLLPVVALALLSTGCSLAFVNGPPRYIPSDEPVPIGSCTIDRTLPLVDAIGAGTFLVTTLTSSDGTDVRISALVGAALGFSSYTGFRRVGRCRERVLQRVEETFEFMAPAASVEIVGVRSQPWRTAPSKRSPKALDGRSPKAKSGAPGLDHVGGMVGRVRRNPVATDGLDGAPPARCPAPIAPLTYAGQPTNWDIFRAD